jgi:signal transduction histidine kinase
MLYEFITVHRNAIIARSRQKVTARKWPVASPDELEDGVPLFLTALAETLRSESLGIPHVPGLLGSGATRHGRELMALGFTVSQVVHDYGDICQAVTELAIEERAPITTDEFKTLNGCLDVAIAEAVTEHARITAATRSADESERSGYLAHQTRDLLNTALLAFHTLKRGTVAINGSTGAVLGRSLMDLRDLVDSTLCEIRISTNQQNRDTISVTAFLNEIALGAALHVEARGLTFVLDAGNPRWAVTADPQIFASAVTNLLNNAFKYTPSGGQVALRTRIRDGTRLLIEVQDECGGISEGVDLFQPFGHRRGRDRTGLGLGLSMARKAVRAHGGDITLQNKSGKGCMFVIDVPLSSEEMLLPPEAAPAV